MDITGIDGFRMVTRVAVVTAAMTALSGVAWAQYSSGASGAGPHTGSSSTSNSSGMYSGMSSGASGCNPGASVVDSRCAQSNGSSGSAASSEEGGTDVNQLQTRQRNDKVPSRPTDQ